MVKRAKLNGIGTGEVRNWAELNAELLSQVLVKVGAIDILMRAQFVCKRWRNLSFDPTIFKAVDMALSHVDNLDLANLEDVIKEAVNRSHGQLEALWLEERGNDDFFRYIADRTGKLKRLHLICINHISDDGLSELLSRNPEIQELGMALGSYSFETCEVIGKACPNLINFQFNKKQDYLDYDSDTQENDEDNALAIADYMPQLRRLQIIKLSLSNSALFEILDSCTHLEYLDIRGCAFVNVDAVLRAKFAKIKEIRLPDEELDDLCWCCLGSAFTWHGH